MHDERRSTCSNQLPAFPICSRTRPISSVRPETPGLSAWLGRVLERPSVAQAVREMAAGYAASNEPDSLFDTNRLHWRNDRIEAALRCGLGRWLLDELDVDRAFLPPVP